VENVIYRHPDVMEVAVVATSEITASMPEMQTRFMVTAGTVSRNIIICIMVKMVRFYAESLKKGVTVAAREF
jgi:hypothetical protein